MLGWSIGFFLAAIVAAIFGFGGMASAFAGIAQILFWVFLALLLISLVFGLFTGHAPDGHAVTHGGGGGFAFLAVALVAAFAVYAWMDNDMSAERAGRELDQTAANISSEAGEAIEEAGDRAQNLIDDTADEMEEDVEQADERASG
jgi:uncharacterized membrane protein YtjA (UPF0391 family)